MVSHSLETTVADRCCNTSCAPGCHQSKQEEQIPGINQQRSSNRQQLGGSEWLKRCSAFSRGSKTYFCPATRLLTLDTPLSSWISENFHQQKA